MRARVMVRRQGASAQAQSARRTRWWRRFSWARIKRRAQAKTPWFKPRRLYAGLNRPKPWFKPPPSQPGWFKPEVASPRP